MKIEDLLIKEDYNNIHLHKEGVFWRAYEYSAYAFVNSIKQYNAKKKFIKKVNSKIPVSSSFATRSHLPQTFAMRIGDSKGFF